MTDAYWKCEDCGAEGRFSSTEDPRFKELSEHDCGVYLK